MEPQPSSGVIPAMKRLVAAAVLLGALAVPAAGASTAAPLLAIVGGGENGNGSLVRLDPVTLRRMPGPAVTLGAFEEGWTDGWSYSPDRRELLLGFANPSCVGGTTALRFVDTARMRALGDVPLLPNGTVEATDWLDATHVLALVQASDCVNDTGTVVFGVDPAALRVVSRTPVAGDVVAVARAARRLVLLVAPRNRIGPASLAVVDAGGKLRRVALPGVRAGRRLSPTVSPPSPSRTDVPGLAVDGEGRAYVVPAAGPIAEVDLATLRTSRHALREQRTLAKGPTGPLRTALWLPNGVLAVTGWNFGVVAGQPQATPAGLELVDVRTWRFRVVAADWSSAQLAGGVVVASSLRGTTLTAYSLSGVPRYTKQLWFEGALGRRGYGSAGVAPTIVFDLRTGKIERSAVSPGQLLLGAAAPFAVGGF